MILAIIVYLAAASAVTLVEPWLYRRGGGHAITAWYTEHVYLPSLRVLVVVVFVAVAYPALFGAVDAPPIWALFRSQPERGVNLINLLMLIALLLPLVPIARRVPAAVLLSQGMIATSMLFSWLVNDIGRSELSSWPGIGVIALTLLFSLLSFALARLLIWLLHSDERSTSAVIAREGTRLYAALPAILLYGNALGERLR